MPEGMTTTKRPKRNALATRNAILAAAKRAFTAKGYDAAGVRDIAAVVGVNAALVNRYFGSKEGLFEEAVIPNLNIDELMVGDRATFGERAAAYMATKTHEGDDLDPTLAFVRSAGNSNVNSMLSEAIERKVVAKLAGWLGGKDAEQRAALIVAHLAGFDMLRRMIDVKALAPEHLDAIAPRFAKILQSYADDCI